MPPLRSGRASSAIATTSKVRSASSFRTIKSRCSNARPATLQMFSTWVSTRRSADGAAFPCRPSGRGAHLRRSQRQAKSDQPVHSEQSSPGAQTRDRQRSKCFLRGYRQGGQLMEPLFHAAPPVGARIFGDRNDKQSPISQFIQNNQVQVLKRETGNAPNVFYVGIDKEVS